LLSAAMVCAGHLDVRFPRHPYVHSAGVSVDLGRILLWSQFLSSQQRVRAVVSAHNLACV
jgi:hypothetical protein